MDRRGLTEGPLKRMLERADVLVEETAKECLVMLVEKKYNLVDQEAEFFIRIRANEQSRQEPPAAEEAGLPGA